MTNMVSKDLDGYKSMMKSIEIKDHGCFGIGIGYKSLYV